MNPKSTALTEIGLPSWLVPIAKSVSYSEARLLESMGVEEVYSYDVVESSLFYGAIPYNKRQRTVLYFVLKEEPTWDDE